MDLMHVSDNNQYYEDNFPLKSKMYSVIFILMATMITNI